MGKVSRNMGGTCIPSENHGADMELKRLFEEPYAGKPHVRFREGRTEKSDSVYSTPRASACGKKEELRFE
jgi:hypothetical protein